MIRYTLRQLEYFVAVGETGSVASAANYLNVSPPAISTAIYQLEEEFDLSLFVRIHARGMNLTPEGQKLIEHARQLLKAAETLTEISGVLSSSKSGPLSVGCYLTFAHIVMPSLRIFFHEKYPDIQIKQHELNQKEIFEQLRQSKLDIALSYDLDVPMDLEFFPVAKLPPFAIFAESHPLAKQSQVTVDELKDYPLVLLDLPHSSEYFLSFFIKFAGKIKISERTQDMAVMQSLVANEFGFSIANVRPLKELSPDGLPLKFVPISGSVKTLPMGFLIAKGADKSEKIKIFRDYCTKIIQSNKIPGLKQSKF